MVDRAVLFPVFETLATNAMIGKQGGVPAYAYLRVSGDDQADEGRSGLPRQLTHIHETAQKQGYAITWEHVFADDFTGFQFEDRPALSVLRRDYTNSKRAANIVVMESLDRLSRNADWHQGFLLDEMKRNGITPIFWKSFGSLIERSVLGAVAQVGMEQEKKRMMEGNLHKARSGRVTARVAAYGYKFVDSNGNEGANARKDTHYAIKEEEAVIIRLIFERMVEGKSLYSIKDYLEELGIPPPKKYAVWQTTQIRLFLRNEVYKGDFYAHRWKHSTVEKPAKNGVGTRKVKQKVERPREEWIHVAVPAIVSRELWESANRMLEQNKKTARRNAKVPYLLTGLIRCARCGYAYAGVTHKKSRGKLRDTPYRGYFCCSRWARSVRVLASEPCDNRYISANIIEPALWKVITDALLQPDVLLDALNNDAGSQRNQQLREQITFLNSEITRKEIEDEKLYKAYLADAFDEAEFASRRQYLRHEMKRLRQEKDILEESIISETELEARKADVITLAAHFQTMELSLDPPFEVKQQLVKLLVDRVFIDAEEKWFKIEGAINGAYHYPIESNPVPVDTF